MSALTSLMTAPRRAMRALRDRYTHTLAVDPRSDAAMAMFGDAGFAARRLARAYFGHDESPRFESEFHGLNLDACAHAMMVKHGMVIFAETHRLPRLANSLVRMQSFVPLLIDVGASVDAYRATLSGSAKEDVRRARNRDFSVEIHRDVAWTREFHDRYHQPTVSLRHGEDGFVAEIPQMVSMINDQNGEFLCIVKGGVRVAAVLALRAPTSYRLCRLGWLNADAAILKDGAVGALYWYSVCRARDLGLRNVSLGGIAPILEEGLTRFKLKWNPEIDADYKLPWCAHYLLLDPRHAHVRRMLAQTSIILHDRGARYFVISAKTPDGISLCEPMRRTLTAWYRFDNSPDANREIANANTPLPSQLRAWCVREPLLPSA